jgi:predicted DNA-binding protein YlxM (UPF0122 family)
LFAGQVAKSSQRTCQANSRFLFMNKDITPPKWTKGFKEDSFNKLSQVDKEGGIIEFDPSDGGKFERDLFTFLEVEIVTCDLGKKEKEALRLKSDGLTRKEIAEEMGIKENAVKQLLHRTGRKLKKNGKEFKDRQSPDYRKLLKNKVKTDPAYRKFRRKINVYQSRIQGNY